VYSHKTSKSQESRLKGHHHLLLTFYQITLLQQFLVPLVAYKSDRRLSKFAGVEEGSEWNMRNVNWLAIHEEDPVSCLLFELNVAFKLLRKVAWMIG
jgi:hypothetical protein